MFLAITQHMIIVDAIKKSSKADQIPLKWVGMEKVILPISFLVGGIITQVPCTFDVFVNLENPSKGIHMSRLYEILNRFSQLDVFSIQKLRDLIPELIESQNSLSSTAKLGIGFSMPLRVETLKSKKSYFKSVPLCLTMVKTKEAIVSELSFQLEYSSTCPQSAALAHQLTIQEMEAFNSLSGPELLSWYHQRGFIATPHAQRSRLDITLELGPEFELSQFPDLFLQLGNDLGTPTQGLVKREDEQEFAKLNADNLMFCEDAARKLILNLKQCPLVIRGHGKVTHLESLHSHNAVAYFEF